MTQWLLLVVRDTFEKQPSSSRFQRSIIPVVKVVNDHDSNVVEGHCMVAFTVDISKALLCAAFRLISVRLSNCR
jgi:hypothetical protein